MNAEFGQEQRISSGVDLEVVLKPMVKGIVNTGIADGSFDGTASAVWGLRRKGK